MIVAASFSMMGYLLLQGVRVRHMNATGKDGSTVRSEFAYYIPRTLNRTVPAYRTSIQFLKRAVTTYRTRTIPKKAYRTS